MKTIDYTCRGVDLSLIRNRNEGRVIARLGQVLGASLLAELDPLDIQDIYALSRPAGPAPGGACSSTRSGNVSSSCPAPCT